jgi:hypothetical protein
MAGSLLHGSDFSNSRFALEPITKNFAATPTDIAFELLNFIMNNYCVPPYASSLAQRGSIFGEGMKLALLTAGAVGFTCVIPVALAHYLSDDDEVRERAQFLLTLGAFSFLGVLAFGTLAALSLSCSPTCG